MLYICSVVFPRCRYHICIISLFMATFSLLDIEFGSQSFSASCSPVFSTCYMHMHPPLQTNHHVDLFLCPPLCLSPPSPCGNYKMLFCAGVPQRPCMKFIGPESCHLTRKTWLTDLVPFPISSGSRVKLTFPASRLYLNSEHQRLMAPWEILLSTLSICLT